MLKQAFKKATKPALHFTLSEKTKGKIGFKSLEKPYNITKGSDKYMVKNFTIIIHKAEKDETGYWAECLQLPGCFTEGETIEEIRENMKEAILLYLEDTDLSQIQDVITETITLEEVAGA